MHTLIKRWDGCCLKSPLRGGGGSSGNASFVGRPYLCLRIEKFAPSGLESYLTDEDAVGVTTLCMPLLNPVANSLQLPEASQKKAATVSHARLFFLWPRISNAAPATNNNKVVIDITSPPPVNSWCPELQLLPSENYRISARQDRNLSHSHFAVACLTYL